MPRVLKWLSIDLKYFFSYLGDISFLTDRIWVFNPTCITQLLSEISKYYEDLKLPTEFLSENSKCLEQKRSLQYTEELQLNTSLHPAAPFLAIV